MIELKLIPVTISELKPLIAFAYKGDEDLLSKYQADKSRDYQACVDFNYNEVKEMSENEVFKGDVHPYKISLQSGDEINDIGYCVVITNESKPQMLLSYSINVAYRKRVFLEEWVRKVDQLLGLPYYTAVWDFNTRAQAFLKKNGFYPIKSDTPNFEYWVRGIEELEHYKKSRLWQLFQNDKSWQSPSQPLQLARA